MIKKQMYEAPATEVLELRLEGTVLAESIQGSGVEINNRGAAFETDGSEW